MMHSLELQPMGILDSPDVIDRIRQARDWVEDARQVDLDTYGLDLEVSEGIPWLTKASAIATRLILKAWNTRWGRIVASRGFCLGLYISFLNSAILRSSVAFNNRAQFGKLSSKTLPQEFRGGV